MFSSNSNQSATAMFSLCGDTSTYRKGYFPFKQSETLSSCETLPGLSARRPCPESWDATDAISLISVLYDIGAMIFPGLMFAYSNQGHISYSLRFSFTCHEYLFISLFLFASDLNATPWRCELIFLKDLQRLITLPLDVAGIKDITAFRI